MTRRITILGSTGSIGTNTLDLIGRAPKGDWQVVGLSANRNAEKLAEQAKAFNAEAVAIADPSAVSDLTARLAGTGIDILSGSEGVIELARRDADFTMAAIVGSAGLAPTMATVEQGKTIGLANKECLVCAGDAFMAAIERHGTTLLPVDSEHNAIFQVLERDQPKGVRRLILTASGGPFRETPMEKLQAVTREDALNHPVWSMGAKISIDSATLMNKGLELIEAAYLFERPSAEIDVVVHPQSIIHSMVEYVDGSVLSQMGSPDMRTPIGYALGWPARMETPVERLDFTAIEKLTFFAPDTIRFPCLRLAREALEMGGEAPCVLNAANEVAVAAFLHGAIGFMDIPRLVENALNSRAKQASFGKAPGCMDSVLALDLATRATADEQIVNL